MSEIKITKDMKVDDFRTLSSDAVCETAQYLMGGITIYHEPDQEEQEDEDSFDIADGWYEDAEDILDAYARAIARKLGFPLEDIHPDYINKIEKEMANISLDNSIGIHENVPTCHYDFFMEPFVSFITKKFFEGWKQFGLYVKPFPDPKWKREVMKGLAIFTRNVGRSLGFKLYVQKKERHVLEIVAGDASPQKSLF